MERALHFLEASPILYFLGVAPGRYALVFPTYVAEWSATELTARLAFGVPDADGTAAALGVATNPHCRQRLSGATGCG